MANTSPNQNVVTVRDARTGRFVTVKGAGALKGKLTISKSIDLTKPISGGRISDRWKARVTGNDSKPSIAKR